MPRSVETPGATRWEGAVWRQQVLGPTQQKRLCGRAYFAKRRAFARIRFCCCLVGAYLPPYSWDATKRAVATAM